MFRIPFAFEWNIPENELKSLKKSTTNGFLKSESITIIPGLKCYLSIFPNGNNKNYRGQTWTFLQLELENVKSVEAEYTVQIQSAKVSKKYLHISKYSQGALQGLGSFNCSTHDFFKPHKKYIVNGNFTIKFHGFFKYEVVDSVSGENKENGGELGNKLWENEESKDFTIAVDGKELKVHKLILGTESTVFAAMFDIKMKEAVENRVDITDFSFNVVENAIKLIYGFTADASLSTDEIMSLLQFFDKYNLSSYKKTHEAVLIKQISSANVCRLANCAVLTNSMNLKEKCMEFIMTCIADHIPFDDFGILDKDFALDVLKNSICQVVHTVEE